ncbi:MAG: hypothetical protein WC444_04690 [Candidatus Paceibacterota bacterium]
MNNYLFRAIAQLKEYVSPSVKTQVPFTISEEHPLPVQVLPKDEECILKFINKEECEGEYVTSRRDSIGTLELLVDGWHVAQWYRRKILTVPPDTELEGYQKKVVDFLKEVGGLRVKDWRSVKEESPGQQIPYYMGMQFDRSLNKRSAQNIMNSILRNLPDGFMVYKGRVDYGPWDGKVYTLYDKILASVIGVLVRKDSKHKIKEFMNAVNSMDGVTEAYLLRDIDHNMLDV